MKNSRLYFALVSEFNKVKIHNQGESARWVKVNDTIKFDHWGECYSVCCPYCNDQKFHLWIGHTFGSIGFPAICYRRNCLSHSWNRIDLIRRIKKNYLTEPLLEPEQNAEISDKTDDLDIYLSAAPLAKVVFKDHPALSLLEKKKLDPVIVSTIYEARIYDLDPTHIAFGRIIFPVKTPDGQLIGWVGRTYLNTEPKYCNSKTRLTQSLFNIERINSKDAIFIVEGIFDAIYLHIHGLPAVAALSSHLSQAQIDLLDKWPVKIIMFDADAYDKAIACSRKISNAFVWKLREGDPDELDSRELQDILAFVHRIAPKKS